MRSFSHKKKQINHLLRTAFLSIGALVLICGLTVTGSYAQSVTLAWDTNTEPDLAGYIVYYGTTSRNYPNSVDVGLVNSHEVTDLMAGQTYYFAVTAYDTSGNESEVSNEASKEMP
jgi:fibronectin type 3 domain-containing protein